MYVHHAWDEKLKLSLGHEFCLNIIRVYYTWKWHGFESFHCFGVGPRSILKAESWTIFGFDVIL